MKKVLSVLFAIIILCMCIIPSYAANPKISVKTVSSASVGETITVSVNLSANSGWGAVDISLNYDTDYFQYVKDSARIGRRMIIDNGKETTLQALVDGQPGKIHFAWSHFDELNTAETAFTATFIVKKINGSFTVSINEVVNGKDKIITSSVSTSGATVKCSHANMKWDILKKATCTEKGEKKGSCTCGYTTTDTIAKTEHSYGKWTVEKEATETEKGLKWAKCSVCGDKKEQVIPVITTTTTETTTETTTFVENTTESTTNEPTTVPTPQIVEKTSTAEIVAKTVAVVLGVEALGLIVFLISKKKKENK